MNFVPKTEEQCSIQPLAKGQYDFEIVAAYDKKSQNENEMIEIHLSVYSDNGGSRTIFDYVMEKLPHKLRHFCRSVGVMDAYETGHLMADMLIGLTGIADIDVEPATEKYKAKNVVRDYIEKPKTAVQPITGSGQVPLPWEN
jgi:hypothetical protein